MILIQIGIIIFLFLILAVIYQDEYKKRKLNRKSARLNRFWTSAHPPGKERRKTLRINAEIEVLYEVASANAVRKVNSISRNISLGGINLALNEKLFPGTILKLQLNIPERSRPIISQGEIVWVKETPKKFMSQKEQRIFATGIKFIQMDPKDETDLNRFITQRIKDVKKE